VLSTFFGKSKPINFVVVAFYMLVLFLIAHYKSDLLLVYAGIPSLVGKLILYVLSMLILNFIVQKNDFITKSTYTILLYAVITAILPNALTNFNLLLSNVFVLAGLTSILHLQSEKQIKSKVLNASICIGLASLAYFWSIGFIILVFIGVLSFDPKDYRNWIIPIIGLGVVYLFANCYTLYVEDSFYTLTRYLDAVSFSFDNYLIKDQLFSVGIVAICSVIFSFFYALKFKRKMAKIKPILRIVIAYLIVGCLIALIAPQKNSAELLFMIAPLAIIGTTYLEMKNYNLTKEINIWVFVLIPFTVLLF